MKRQPFLDGPVQIVLLLIMISCYVVGAALHANGIRPASILIWMGAYQVGHTVGSMVYWIFKGKWR